MRLYKHRKSPHWWISWNDQDGRRHRRSSGTADKRLAEALAAEWVKQSFLVKHFGKKTDVPFSEALLRYARTHKRDHPRSFMRSTRYRLQRFQERFGKRMLAEITFPVVQEYLDERL